MAGSSIVRTRPRNHAWDHCGETSAYKTTQRPLLYLCLNEWDVLMWSIRLCNSLGEASPYKVTWLHRLISTTFDTSVSFGYQATKFKRFFVFLWKQYHLGKIPIFVYCVSVFFGDGNDYKWIEHFFMLFISHFHRMSDDIQIKSWLPR